jgi:hypothetical protein
MRAQTNLSRETAVDVPVLVRGRRLPPFMMERRGAMALSESQGYSDLYFRGSWRTSFRHNPVCNITWTGNQILFYTVQSSLSFCRCLLLYIVVRSTQITCYRCSYHCSATALLAQSFILYLRSLDEKHHVRQGSHFASALECI